MKDMQLVSIITPCYNSSKFITQTLESVLAQTYKNWEMILIDDCSNDSTVDIINEFIQKDERIKFFSTNENSGSPVNPRNIGIEKAQGRYIAFLDSDDIWLSTKLENQVRLFTNNNVAIVFSFYEKISEDGTRKNRVVVSPNYVSYKQLLKGNCIGCLTAVYDVEKIGKKYFKYIGHEDYEYWLSMLRLGYIANNTNTVEALYRVRINSVSTDKLKSARWTWNIYNKILKLDLGQSIYYFYFYIMKSLGKYLK